MAAQTDETAPPIPRRIWTLWLQGWDDAPVVVARCLGSWRYHNPDWEVLALDAATVADHLPPGLLDDVADLSPTQRSDVVRLALLARHGGVWVDATVGCRHPLDSWLPAVTPAGFFAFGGDGPDRLAEPWFLAAARDNVVAQRWADEFLAYARVVNAEAPNRLQRAVQHRLWRVLHRSRFGLQSWMWPPVRRVLRTNPYFAVHYVFNRLMRTDPQCRRIWDATPARPPRATARSAFSGHYEAPATPGVRAEADAATSPVVKLNWKFPVEVGGSETRVGYLSRTLCDEHPGPVPDL